jgi:RNA polymerase sigma-70 factor (ECF subfamily)
MRPGRTLQGDIVNANQAKEDEATVDRVLAGDVAAFAGIVHRWQGPLINLAWRFCRDRSRAEDLAQEAFLRAHRNLGQWRRESTFSTWLFALAANVYRTEIRRIPALTLSISEITEPHDPRESTTGFEDADEAENLRRAVLALPARYRDALLLYYFHEQDVAAAAHTLAVPEGTIKARLFRGREMLRAKFARTRTAPRASDFETRRLKEVP